MILKKRKQQKSKAVKLKLISIYLSITCCIAFWLQDIDLPPATQPNFFQFSENSIFADFQSNFKNSNAKPSHFVLGNLHTGSAKDVKTAHRNQTIIELNDTSNNSSFCDDVVMTNFYTPTPMAMPMRPTTLNLPGFIFLFIILLVF